MEVFVSSHIGIQILHPLSSRPESHNILQQPITPLWSFSKLPNCKLQYIYIFFNTCVIHIIYTSSEVFSVFSSNLVHSSPIVYFLDYYIFFLHQAFPQIVIVHSHAQIPCHLYSEETPPVSFYLIAKRSHQPRCSVEELLIS